VRHAKARDRLSAYLEHDLGESETSALEVHLAGCDACRADLEDLRASVVLLQRLAAPEPPPFLAARVMARIRDGEGRPAGWREWLGNLAAPAIAAPLAAVAAAAAVVYFAEPPRKQEIAILEPMRAKEMPLVPRPVGPAPAAAVFAAGSTGALARNLRGAGHPHSTQFATHFEPAADAVAVTWQPR